MWSLKAVCRFGDPNGRNELQWQAVGRSDTFFFWVGLWPSLSGLAWLAAVLMLAACGFRPVYDTNRDAGIDAELRAVRVAPFPDRLGQILRNETIDQLNPEGTQGPAEYDLVIQLTRRITELAIQLDDVVTRQDLTLTARYELRDRSDGTTLLRSAATRVAGFNVGDDPFATLSSEQDAERRAAIQVSRDIRVSLSDFFARREP
ncbi:MAG: LPS assembly lipoprotein LptE [Geminicoccaceae bacterium]